MTTPRPLESDVEAAAARTIPGGMPAAAARIKRARAGIYHYPAELRKPWDAELLLEFLLDYATDEQLEAGIRRLNRVRAQRTPDEEARA